MTKGHFHTISTGRWSTWESGAAQVKELVSHELPLEEYGKDLRLIMDKKARKVVVHP